ncbi:hypothetical protein BHE74_00000358 [Ensete ventricosum]|nr:hypothetical protein BHE74_00000358 [Ensete ventricosum]RZR76299.1 hypothetical protein BHM03_00000970 [Ensete ventricosum]
MAESKVNPTADNESSSRSQLHGMRCGYRSEGEGASAPSRCHIATYGYAVRGGGKLPPLVDLRAGSNRLAGIKSSSCHRGDGS